MTGAVRDCEHKRAHHEHGTRNAYVLDKCRCRPCTDATRDYERARTRRVIRETYHPDEARLVDAEPIRQHLRDLAAAGMGLKTVSKVGGIAHGTLYPILYGKTSPDPRECRPPRKRISRDIADRILAVRPVLADGARVDATGTRRRLQALVAIGYTRVWLADQIGVNTGNLDVLTGGHSSVTAATARAVTDLYDRYWSTPGPNLRARRRAARLGWLPPLAWDDDTIDDPTATPADTARPAGRGQGVHQRRAEDVVEDWHDTWDHHLGDLDLAAHRLGMARNTLHTALLRAQHAGIPVRRAAGAAA
jgi:hypothetical protein